ncbi:hypothetical protein GQ53DRAFT_180115 [Thozetella sp. PMI_491]|nr:hypothetical protein GQ53DRAFT_180115 [Thozetella sp. PMI_491]
MYVAISVAFEVKTGFWEMEKAPLPGRSGWSEVVLPGCQEPRHAGAGGRVKPASPTPPPSTPS